MNAPKKIYLIRNIPSYTSLNTTNDCHEKYLQEWHKSREKDADVEYVRSDVFIEKAKKWFNSKNGIVITDAKALFEEFIDYIGIE